MKTDFSDHWPVVHSTPCMAKLRFEAALRRIAESDSAKERTRRKKRKR